MRIDCDDVLRLESLAQSDNLQVDCCGDPVRRYVQLLFESTTAELFRATFSLPGEQFVDRSLPCVVEWLSWVGQNSLHGWSDKSVFIESFLRIVRDLRQKVD